MDSYWLIRVNKHFVESKEVLIADINPNSRDYQRPLELTWIGKLIDDMKTNGYDRAHPIIVTDLLHIVDGQHRYDAAKEYGMLKIPAVIYSFDTFIDEVLEYYRQNDWHHSHNTKMYWHARNLAKEEIAQLLYRLENDEKSLLHNDINFYQKEGPHKYKIPQALMLLNYAIGIDQKWSRNRDDKIRELLVNYNYDDIRYSINSMLGFIYHCWGKDKQIAHVVYMAKIFEALIYFYKILKMNHKLAGKYEDSAIKRMKKFSFDEAFRNTSHSARILLLKDYYDKFSKKEGTNLLKIH